MFNPQRRNKIADIYMQQQSFQIHLEKMNRIRSSHSPLNTREEEKKQSRYLQRLHMSKQQVKERLNGDLVKQNHRIFNKLVETDHWEELPEDDPEKKNSTRKHFNSYINNKRKIQRIQEENFGIINRMINQTSLVPSLSQLKKEFKQSKRYANMVRKLPTILKHEEQIKQQVRQKRLSNSRTSVNSSRHASITQRGSSHQMKHLQKGLISKQ